jgi:hypothetical protein
MFFVMRGAVADGCLLGIGEIHGVSVHHHLPFRGRFWAVAIQNFLASVICQNTLHRQLCLIQVHVRLVFAAIDDLMAWTRIISDDE